MKFPRPSASVLRLALASLLLGTAALTSGCVAVVAAGAAGTGVAWYRGKLTTTVNEDLVTVYQAAQKALVQLEFAKVSEKRSGLDAELVARTALDKRIVIVLQRTGPETTETAIRVGVFGDEAMSLAILDKIRSNL